MQQILNLDPANYSRHRIHSQERDWAETNCYVDIWIELLHSLGHEPIAAMPYTLAIDFEGDQWTFFKFPLADIYDLYGIDVQELAIWQPLTKHIEEQVGLGRPVLVELDSFFLPDTAGMAYKLAHVKSTVAVTEIDLEKNHLGYFHGQGYYHLPAEDFLDVFRLRDKPDPAVLSPYVEIAKLKRLGKLPTAKTLEISLKLLQKQLTLLPTKNPFHAFKTKFESDVKWLSNENLETFHQYSFATLRQFGACYELAANYLSWLSSQGESGLKETIKQTKSISETAKVYQFQLARVITRGKTLDLSPIDAMANSWGIAMQNLTKKYL
ncbi:FIG00999102: hypothetical protein [hydrothermal vent metagenome]|uniref:DUF1839 family protein n=1 Tax=hydrothermal vent metagenome TaxID=652676 RepID=A0A3B0ZZL3_9ZZZZ